MNPQQLVAKYGSQVAVAKAFGVTRAAVQLWVRQGKVPQARLWQHKAGLVKPPQGR
jgi:predicted transcriptional regulator